MWFFHCFSGYSQCYCPINSPSWDTPQGRKCPYHGHNCNAAGIHSDAQTAGCAVMAGICAAYARQPAAGLRGAKLNGDARFSEGKNDPQNSGQGERFFCGGGMGGFGGVFLPSRLGRLVNSRKSAILLELRPRNFLPPRAAELKERKLLIFPNGRLTTIRLSLVLSFRDFSVGARLSCSKFSQFFLSWIFGVAN